MTTFHFSVLSSSPVPFTSSTPSCHPFEPSRHKKDLFSQGSSLLSPYTPWAESSHGRLQMYPQLPAHGGGHPGNRLLLPQQRPLHHPPAVVEEEKLLPRRLYFDFSLLLSGYCSSLNRFLYRVHRALDSLCSSCRGTLHIPAHLFSYPSHPTHL